MQNIRKIFLPFSWLYAAIVWLRNKFFDWGWFSSKQYDFPVICVGNISVGGTGKSPMIEYLVTLLKEHYQIATLSRGYKRQTKGFYRLKGGESVTETGDEPLQFKTKFPEIAVAVDENRQHGIMRLRQLHPQPEVILLDDAFQHRKVTPGLSIVLTTYNTLYTSDKMLPAGNLREPQSGAQRANIIVVSKCPENIAPQEQREIRVSLQLHPHQQLFFSFIRYAEFLTNGKETCTLKQLPANFCLVTGIAKPTPLVHYLKKKGLSFQHRRFPDHYNFTESNIQNLRQKDFIVSTEKDFMRLKPHLPSKKLFYLPIQQEFISNSQEFTSTILNFIKTHYK